MTALSKHNLVILIFTAAVLFSVFPFVVHGQEFVELEAIPGVDYNESDPSGFFNEAFTIGIGIAALLAVIMITIGGFEYLTSDIPASKRDGKERITGAILGLFIILLSVVILNVINPDITSLSFF